MRKFVCCSCDSFVYFGGSGPNLPSGLACLRAHRGHRSRFSSDEQGLVERIVPAQSAHRSRDKLVNLVAGQALVIQVDDPARVSNDHLPLDAPIPPAAVFESSDHGISDRRRIVADGPLGALTLGLGPEIVDGPLDGLPVGSPDGFIDVCWEIAVKEVVGDPRLPVHPRSLLLHPPHGEGMEACAHIDQAAAAEGCRDVLLREQRLGPLLVRG